MSETHLAIDQYLRSTWLAIQKMYNEQAAKFNSTMVMGFTLLSIDPKTGTPSTSLGPKMGIEPTSLSRTLKNLEIKGLIVRKPNPQDGRSVIVTLTEEGLNMRNVSKEVVLGFYESVEQQISKEELRIFFEVLFKINKIATEEKIQKKQLN